MSRYGETYECETECTRCNGEIELRAGIGYPDRSVGYNSAYIDYLEEVKGRDECPHCNQGFDWDELGEHVIDRWISSQEPSV